MDKRLWQADHHRKCKATYKGSAPAMETEEVKRIFECSEEKNKLHYTEYYGDSDSKGFIQVENSYKDKGVNIVKKECVGHVQKRVGTALRKLKKRKKGLAGRGKLTNAMIDRLLWHSYSEQCWRPCQDEKGHPCQFVPLCLI